MNSCAATIAAVMAGIASILVSAATEAISCPIPARILSVTIDAPEIKGRCPSENEAAGGARQYLVGLVGSELEELRDERREKYGRPISTLTAGGPAVSTG